MSGRHVIIINNALANFDPSTEEGTANRSKCTAEQITEIDRLRSVDQNAYAHTAQDKAFVIGVLNEALNSD